MPIMLNRLLLFSLFGLAAVMAWQFRQRLYEDKRQLAITFDADTAGTVVLSWHHEIKLPMAKLMYDAFNEQRDRVRRIVIDLDSPGGSLNEGQAVIELIADMKKTHQVDTRVAATHDCLSMCVPIFLQGEKRMAAASSRWMFHEPRAVDYFSGDDIKKPEFEKKYHSQHYLDKYFRNSPINQDWLAATQPQWQGRDVWRSGRQLFDENSNIINELL
jgi:hypothetical protein